MVLQATIIHLFCKELLIDNDHHHHLAFLRSEFQRLFDNFDYESIREDILNRKLIQSNFTTIFWRIFLQCLPSASNRWDDAFDTNRRNYEKLRQHYTIDPYKMSNENPDGIHINHPLSRDENVGKESCLLVLFD